MDRLEPEYYLRIVTDLLKNRLLIVSVVVVSVLAAGLLAFLSPNVYTASVLLMPEARPAEDVPLQMKRAINMVAPGSGVVGRTEVLCLDLLSSQRLLNAVIDRLPELSRTWEHMRRQQMRKTLRSRCTFEATESGLLRIAATMADAQLSARLANTLASELQDLYRSLMVESARREIEFLRKRLAATSRELAASEEKLAEFQRTRKMLRPDESATATFSALMSLETRIIEEEAKLEVLRSYASQSNPQLALQMERVKALKKSVAGIEQDGDQPSTSYIPHQALIPLERLPEVGLEGVRLAREVLLREKLYLFLMERYEGAKLAETRESSALTIIDRAEPPEAKSGPCRKRRVAFGAFLGLAAGISCALVRERLRALGSTEEGRKALEEMKKSVRRGG